MAIPLAFLHSARHGPLGEPAGSMLGKMHQERALASSWAPQGKWPVLCIFLSNPQRSRAGRAHTHLVNSLRGRSAWLVVQPQMVSGRSEQKLGVERLISGRTNRQVVRGRRFQLRIKNMIRKKWDSKSGRSKGLGGSGRRDVPPGGRGCAGPAGFLQQAGSAYKDTSTK